MKKQSYLKRKRRTNITIKSQFPEFRCVVTRSLKHIFAQIIAKDGNVLATSTDVWVKWTKTEKAFEVGKNLAKKAIEKKINVCAFDRNWFLYHGRVKALCEGMREWWMTI